MKRTVKFLGVTFGATALLSLGVACSSRQTPAPSVGAMPVPGPTDIPAEPSGATSQMGSPSSMDTQGRSRDQGALSQQGQQGQWGDQGEPGRQQAEPGRVQGDSGRLPGQQGQPGVDAPQGAFGSGLGSPTPGDAQPQAGTTNERALCEALASGSKLHVEDVQNGAAIVAVPRQGSNLATVRDEARRLESAIKTSGQEAHGSTQAAGESCGVTQLGRLPSVTTSITEGANSVRIVMTTSSPSEVKDLRKIARDEIGALNKGATTRPMPR